MLLAVIRRLGIDIPALCHHDAIEPSGSCRLCMVEITRPEWEGWTKHVTSCLYPVEDGLIVRTHTPKIEELRRTLLELFLANSPHATAIQELAKKHGVTQSSFDVNLDGDNCIMCYACTRVCAQLGRHAISAAGRGHDKFIATPLRELPVDCVGCLACAEICPTNFIEYRDDAAGRTIWEKRFEMIKCSSCGRKTITRAFAEYLHESRGIPMEYFETCDRCKRQDLAQKMGRVVIMAKEAAR